MFMKLRVSDVKATLVSPMSDSPPDLKLPKPLQQPRLIDFRRLKSITIKPKHHHHILMKYMEYKGLLVSESISEMQTDSFSIKSFL